MIIREKKSDKFFSFIIKIFRFFSYLSLLLIIVILLFSKNTLIFKSLGARFINHFVGESTTSINNFSELFNYIPMAISGTLKKNSYPKIEVQMKQNQILKVFSKNNKKVEGTAKIILMDDNKTLKAKVRTKGDRDIHNEAFNRSSLRVNMSGSDRLFGLDKFSIQHPIMRGYTWEFLVGRLMSQLQILTLSNYLINYYFNGEKRGIYVIEEVPSNRTLERQGRKAGPIFGLEEKYNINLNQRTLFDYYQSKAWEGTQLLENSQQVLYEFIENLEKDSYQLDIYFDVEKWAKYFALSDLFGTYHGTIPKSVKFYSNPVTGKIEPIFFDGHKGAGSFDNFLLLDFIQSKDVECEYICEHRPFYNVFLKNSKFLKEYLAALDYVVSNDFLTEVKNIYINEFESMDREFYSKFMPSDGIFHRNFNLYHFDLNEIDKRANLIEGALERFRKNQSLKISKKIQIQKSNKLITDGSLEIIDVKNFNFIGENWFFDKPTLVIMSGNTILSGSDATMLNITGPVMFVQTGGNIKLHNINFKDIENHKIKNRNWSGALNIIDSNVKIDNLNILSAFSEDAINIIGSDINLNNVSIYNSKSDALDLDFSNGNIQKLKCNEIGNDCLDTSESNINVEFIDGKNVLDKVVSAGENSNLKIANVKIENSGVGLVSKDGSNLDIQKVTLKEKVDLLGANFIKKVEYDFAKLKISKIISEKSNLTILVDGKSENDLPVEVNKKILSSTDIEKLMYGAVYGAKTIK